MTVPSTTRTALAPWLPPRSSRLRATLSRVDRDDPAPQHRSARPVTVAVQITVTGPDAIELGAEIADRFRALAATLSGQHGAADASIDAALVLDGRPTLPGVEPPRAGEPRVRIVPADRTVLLDGEPVEFTRREFDLLLYLAQQPGRVFSRPQLLQAVWGYTHLSGERTVDVHVRRVRAKLRHHEALLKTVRGVGYRLAGPGLADVVE